MMRLFIYLFILGLVLYVMSRLGKPQDGLSEPASRKPGLKSKNPFRSRLNARELWVQVYETDSLEEARTLQARLQEEEIDCVLYEQGKKDIHGQPMKGFGISVPKTAASQSQTIISRT